eukprot:SAG11_NODE_1667_length_4494_cov_5.922412_4_plen_193_part_00
MTGCPWVGHANASRIFDGCGISRESAGSIAAEQESAGRESAGSIAAEQDSAGEDQVQVLARTERIVQLGRVSAKIFTTNKTVHPGRRYIATVGHGGTLNMNIAPAADGLLNDSVVAVMREAGRPPTSSYMERSHSLALSSLLFLRSDARMNLLRCRQSTQRHIPAAQCWDGEGDLGAMRAGSCSSSRHRARI